MPSSTSPTSSPFVKERHRFFVRPRGTHLRPWRAGTGIRRWKTFGTRQYLPMRWRGEVEQKKNPDPQVPWIRAAGGYQDGPGDGERLSCVSGRGTHSPDTLRSRSGHSRHYGCTRILMFSSLLLMSSRKPLSTMSLRPMRPVMRFSALMVPLAMRRASPLKSSSV